MPARGRSPDALTVRALNRALLARQFLLERVPVSTTAAIEHLVGLQAQVPDSAYIALWSRLTGFRLEDLARLVRRRRVVRIALMRSTIHLVTSRDGATLRPLMQRAVERGLWSGNYGRSLAGLDRDEVAGVARTILEDQPRRFTELGALLRRRWPRRDAHPLAMAARGLLPLVQIPPRGVWGERGAALHTTFEKWTGRSLAAKPALTRVMLRYLAAFGPSSIADMQEWSGLAGMRALIEPLRRRLRTFMDARGRELFDLPDAPRPDPDTPAPPRFLPEFDNVLLAHADRTRIIAREHRTALFAGAGLLLGPVLLDGFVAGRWRLTRHNRDAILDIDMFVRPAARERLALEDEGARLLSFFAADAERPEMRVTTGVARIRHSR